MPFGPRLGLTCPSKYNANEFVAVVGNSIAPAVPAFGCRRLLVTP